MTDKNDSWDEADALALALSVAEAVPPAGLRARVLERIGLDSAVEIVRSDADAAWRQTPYEGVSVRPLFKDKANRLVTRLIRMQPGSRIPAHSHPHAEQCYVLEGDLCWEGAKVVAGEFFVTPGDRVFPVTWTEGGNLLLLIGPAEAVYS
ncbi:MAG: cupin domain-containing protein [Bryobacteraceae bacterium]|nr:cupin domain-containing protein [Bryobacteraceae bacterium]